MSQFIELEKTSSDVLKLFIDIEEISHIAQRKSGGITIYFKNGMKEDFAAPSYAEMRNLLTTRCK